MINFKEIDAFLFDFGGTLDTNGTHWSEKFWEVYQKFDVPINYEEFREAYINAEPNVKKYINKEDGLFSTLKAQVYLQIDYLTKKGIDLYGVKDKLITRITEACYKDVISNITDIKPILKSLKLSSKIGLVSNFYGNVKAVCKSLEIDSYFDVIVDSTELKISKPDPKIFDVAIEMLKSTPERTVVIGDSYDRDIIPAKKLGCKTVWLKGKSWKNEENNEAADVIISSLFELKKFLGKSYSKII